MNQTISWIPFLEMKIDELRQLKQNEYVFHGLKMI